MKRILVLYFTNEIIHIAPKEGILEIAPPRMNYLSFFFVAFEFSYYPGFYSVTLIFTNLVHIN